VEKEKGLFYSNRVKRAEDTRAGIEQEKSLFHSHRVKKAKDITEEKDWSKIKVYFIPAE